VPTLIAFPVLILVIMLQTIIVSSLPLLNGVADVVLLVLVSWGLQDRVKNAWIWAAIAGLMMEYVSGLPQFVPLAGYLLVMAVARVVRRRVWQTPVLAMFLVTFVGSVGSQGISLAALLASGTPLDIIDSLNLVILPGTLLNLLLALPVFALVVDLAQWLYPEEVEI
jgi:rod shape-determining protein MreD